MNTKGYSRSYLSAAGFISVATMLSRILGLVREQVIAHFFGAGMYADAFQMAFRIPNLLRDLFAEGAMSSALVPIYTKVRREKGEDVAWNLVANVRTLLFCLLLFICLLGIWFARPLVELYAAGFGQVEGKLELTVKLVQVMFPYLPMIALAAVSMGVLNARRHFALPALAPATFNMCSIFAAFVICPMMVGYDQPPIMGMAIGVLLGGFCQWWLQMPLLYREGFKEKLRLQLRDPNLRKMFGLMSIGMAGLAATQINIFVNSRLAASQEQGAVSWLLYAFRFMQLPIGVFGVAIAQVTTTKVAEQVASVEMSEVKKTVAASLRFTWALTIPSACGLILLAQPIIELIYEHGLFTRSDTLATAKALRFYAIGLAAYASVKVLVPVFYSLEKTRAPVIVSFVSVAFNLSFCLLFLPVFGFAGLALGVSCAAIAQFLCLLFLVAWYLQGISWRHLIKGFLIISFASLLMTLVVYGYTTILANYWNAAGFLAQICILACGILAGAVTYWGTTRFLRLEEVESINQVLQRKFGNSAKKSEYDL